MYYFIINPVAGYGTVNRVQEKLRQYLHSIGIEGEYAKTISPGDATHLAKVGIKKGYSRIICVGGDGTVHEVLNGVYGSGVTLGILPFGRHNLLAKALGIPQKWMRACDVLAQNKHLELDVSQVGDRYFLLSAGVGLEAEVASESQVSRSHVVRSYLSDLRPLAPAVPPLVLNMLIDETFIVTTKAVNVSIINSTWSYQHSFPGLHIDPQDQTMNVVVVSHDPKQHVLQNLVSGKVIEGNPAISVFPAKNVQLLTPNDLPIHADGEIIRKTTPIEFTIAPEKQAMIIGS